MSYIYIIHHYIYIYHFMYVYIIIYIIVCLYIYIHSPNRSHMKTHFRTVLLSAPISRTRPNCLTKPWPSPLRADTTESNGKPLNFGWLITLLIHPNGCWNLIWVKFHFKNPLLYHVIYIYPVIIPLITMKNSHSSP